MKKVVIAGGAGYLGRALTKHFLARDIEVVTLTRTILQTLPRERFAVWDGVSVGPWANELEGADALINLAGRTVNCRYSEKNRKEMMDSRIQSTRALGLAVSACENPPKVWLNSSTATIYRHALDREQTEAGGELGKGLSVEIAKAWEKELFVHAREGVRQVALRSAMVFGEGRGGVYEAFREIAKQGLGGRAGDGTQFVSWLHLEDFIGMIDWILDHPEMTGAINLASPEPQTNEVFMRTLRKSLGVRFGLNAPEWMLEVGAFFKRTETELLLKSRRVVPEKLLKAGYQMKYPNLAGALQNLATS